MNPSRNVKSAKLEENTNITVFDNIEKLIYRRSIKQHHDLIFMNPIKFGLQIVEAKSAKTQTQRAAAKIACTCGKTMLRRRKINGCHCQSDETWLSNIALDHVWIFRRIFLITKVLLFIQVHPWVQMEIRDN